MPFGKRRLLTSAVVIMTTTDGMHAGVFRKVSEAFYNFLNVPIFTRHLKEISEDHYTLVTWSLQNVDIILYFSYEFLWHLIKRLRRIWHVRQVEALHWLKQKAPNKNTLVIHLDLSASNEYLTRVQLKTACTVHPFI